MIIKPIKTEKILPFKKTIFQILDKYLLSFKESSILAVSSKIVSLCENRVVKYESQEQKDEIAKKEADLYLPREFNQYNFMITINKGIMVASSGVDESNGNGHLVLWPKDPQKSANQIREYLLKRFKLNHAGVIITDSKLTPLRWGVTGVAISHSGFRALNSYIGKPDIFGRIMHAEKTNVADALASAAVVVMGEGNEQQPLAIVEDLPFVRFQKRNPTEKELEDLKISIGADVYSSLLTRVKWEKKKIETDF